MKRLLMMGLLVLLGWAVTASAQENPPRGLRSAVGRAVFVIDDNRREWQGRLLKVSVDALEVESDAGIRTFKIENIRRVDAETDGLGDGFLKGAAVGAVFGLLAVANHAEGWVIFSNALSTGLLGLAIDAGCSSRHPVYHGPAVPYLEKPTTHSPGAMQISVKVRW